MQRRAILSVAMALAFGSVGAVAQDGDLSRVTMRVLDDLSDADAVVLELSANRAVGAESDGRAARDAAGRDGDRDAARAEADEDARRDLRRERAELHEDDDRREGRREDRDVERPVTPPSPTP